MTDWGGEGLNAYERIKALSDQSTGVSFRYLRLYKPRDRYGDRAPDNHIVDGKSVSSVEDLELKTEID